MLACLIMFVKYVPRGSDQNVSRSSVLAAEKKAVFHWRFSPLIFSKRNARKCLIFKYFFFSVGTNTNPPRSVPQPIPSLLILSALPAFALSLSLPPLLPVRCVFAAQQRQLPSQTNPRGSVVAWYPWKPGKKQAAPAFQPTCRWCGQTG